MKAIIFPFLLILGLSLVLTSCLKQLVQDPDDHSIKLTYDTIHITKGVTQYLAAKNYDASQVNWSSSDTTIAKIAANGLITAYKPGQVTINAAAKAYPVSAKCIVIVAGDAITETKVSDVAAGADGSVFAIGTDVVSPTGGFGIYKLVGSTLKKIEYSAGTRIAVTPDGKPWVVNKSNLVYRFQDSTSAWIQLPGTATDIAIGGNGAIFAIGTTQVTNGYNVIRWNGISWTEIPGGAGIHIAVDAKGTPWVVNKANAVYKYNGTTWDAVSGVNANDIGIGNDGSVFVTGSDANASVYKLNGSAWQLITGLSATSITVSPSGSAIYIDKTGYLHK